MRTSDADANQRRRRDPQSVAHISLRPSTFQSFRIYNHAHKIIQISRPTVQRIMKKLQWHPFKITHVQKLEPEHHVMRRDFCEWLLSQPADFEQKVIWSDEKWWLNSKYGNHFALCFSPVGCLLRKIQPLKHLKEFCSPNSVQLKIISNFKFSIFRWVLHPQRNRQNDRHWAAYNPHHFEESRIQGDVKAMSWVCSIILKCMLNDDFEEVNVWCDLTLSLSSAYRYLGSSASTAFPYPNR